MLIPGHCHCGNIGFVLHWEPDPPQIPARACDCTFCRKHAAVWTSNPDGLLRVAIAQPAQVARYTFATGTADFHLCMRCGVVPLCTSTIDGRLYAVVNVNSFDDLDPTRLQHSPAHFADEDAATRLARRQRGWIGDVAWAHGRD